MRRVVADAGPLHYLILIDEIEGLPLLFGRVLAPDSVRRELSHKSAPAVVRDWILSPPPWFEVHPAPAEAADDNLRDLDAGERDAIALAYAVGADLLLMDDHAGVAAARERQLRVTGTLGILQLAPTQQGLDLERALARLKATNFRYSLGLLETVLADFNAKRT